MRLPEASKGGYERMTKEKQLYEASTKGSVDSLKQLLAEDPLVLARAAVTCFDETPLHIAAMLGHLNFVKLVVSQKPDMAMALDSQGRSPLHLAASNGYVEIVSFLVSVNSNACVITDEEGRTALHLAVMKGGIEVIKELVRSQPEVTQCRLDQGETLLHLAVKQNRLGALKLLIELGKDDNLVNVKDDNGNTILHLAAAMKQLETIKYLLDRTGVKVNAVNGNGFTVLDVTEHTPRDLKGMEIREFLVKAGALRARNLPALASENRQFIAGNDIAAVTEDSQLVAPPPPPPQARAPSRVSSIKKRLKNHENWLEKKRDTLLIVATVIAAMAYQAGLNPPGSVWQEDQFDSKGNLVHIAGTSIMAFNYPFGYPRFMMFNTVSFIASLSIIFLLISGLPTKKRIFMWILAFAVWVTISCMALTYLTSMQAISPEHESDAIIKVVAISILAWCVLIALVMLAHTIRFLIWCVRKLGKLRRKKPQVLLEA